jgi:hypothetical protein
MIIQTIQRLNYLVFWSKYIELITIIPPNIVIIDGTSLNIKKDKINPNTGNKE